MYLSRYANAHPPLQSSPFRLPPPASLGPRDTATEEEGELHPVLGARVGDEGGLM